MTDQSLLKQSNVIGVSLTFITPTAGSAGILDSYLTEAEGRNSHPNRLTPAPIHKRNRMDLI